MNPIASRELAGILRTKKAFAIQILLALAFTLVVLLRWPGSGHVGLSGAEAQRVFSLFAYGILSALILLIPIFPATSIVRERNQGTLALLLNSPLQPLSIYVGKLTGVFSFSLLLIAISLPAAAACYVMGGISLVEDLGPLYLILILAAAQYVTLGMLVSTYAASTDAAVRITYAFVFLITFISLAPYHFLQGQPGPAAQASGWLRCLSPIPAVLQVLGQTSIGSQGIANRVDVVVSYLILSSVCVIVTASWTVKRLNHRLFDRARSQGIITQDRSLGGRVLRRLLFVFDPQRRSGGIPWYTNPVMAKEFKCRRFGRSHWMMRIIAACAALSLLLTLLVAHETSSWGVETIGGILVILQATLVVVITPSLASGMISTERESGGWDLLKMTPLSPLRIVSGKLMSVFWTLLLVLLATLPGYVVIVFIKPVITSQVERVLICLLLTAGLSVIMSATFSSVFKRTAVATSVAYVTLLVLFAGTMLVWLGRDEPFGHDTVEFALKLNPMAAALNVIETPGFESYDLVPSNWWIVGVISLACFILLCVQTYRLSRPE